MTDHTDASRGVLTSAAREAGLPEIFVPRSIARVPSVPILGTGKIDYVNVGQLASQVARA